MKNIFKQIISDFHTNEVKKWKKRLINIPLNTNKIISIIWPRRSGKSYLLFNIINNLISNWTNITDIIYINFEDERINISGENMQIIIDAYLELYNEKKLGNTYIFFDEIQNIDGWEKFVRRVYDNYSQNIFITWSNAKLLSKEIATSLRWRSLSYEVLPLNFEEFISFKKDEKINIHSTVWKANILTLQKEFITWWWFPEIINYTDDIKLKTLQEYFDVMIYNDIIERYKLKDITLLKLFIKQLIQSTTKEYSINKLWNSLKTNWFKFDKNNLYDFIDYIDNIYFWKSISKYDYSLSKQTLKKIYLFDNWFLSWLSFSFSDNYWKLLENSVFVELYRRFWDNIFFLKNWTETDFFVNTEKNKVFQVCYDLNWENYDREIWWCIDAMKKYEISESYIITFEQEKTVSLEWKNIKILPFYKWILE